MAVSSKSYIHQPIGYTSPVDLNLLGKVLQYKQAQFDAGVNKVQSTIDSVASLDVVKDVDRQYLNSKLNSLVETANNIGGADFSDPNVVNQIAGLSSQIYSDDKIINAVANTKKFRYVQGFYKDLKEKKPKDWNPANEWFDMNKFSGWLSDGQVGTSAEANAGSVTPQVKYEEDWQKMFDKITQAANVTTEITDKGLMYRIDTHKVVSPERIWETASKMLTPSQRQQLGIEGRYTFNALPVSELAKAYNQETYKKVGDATAVLNDYRAKYKGSTAISDQEKYQKLIAEKESEINSLLAPVRRGADQIKENLYINDKLKGLQARYAFQQSNSKIQANSGKMFALKYEMDKQKFTYQQRKDNIDQMIDIADKGLMWYQDPLTGQTTLIADPTSIKNRSKTSTRNANGELDFSGLPGLSNSPDKQKTEYNKEKLDERKTTLVNTNDQLFKKFVADLGRKKGLSDVIINDLADDGHLQAVVDPEMQKTAKDMMDAWNAMTRGEKINFDALDPLFKSFAGEYQRNIKEIEGIDNFYGTINKQIRQKYGVTPEGEAAVAKSDELTSQITRMREDLSSKYGAYFLGESWYNQYPKGTENNEPVRQEAMAQRAAFEDLKRQREAIEATPAYKATTKYRLNRDDEAETLINAASTRFNLPNVTIEDDKQKNLAKMIAGNAGTLQWYDEVGNPKEKATLNPDNVEVMNKGYTTVITEKGASRQPMITFKYKTGTKADEFEIRKVPVTPIQAQILGFGELRDLTGYDFGLHANGEVKDINTTSGKNYDLKYDLVKYNVSDPNDPSVFVRIRKGANVISLYDKPFPSYQHAMQFMESATKQKSADDAYKLLEELAK